MIKNSGETKYVIGLLLWVIMSITISDMKGITHNLNICITGTIIKVR